MNYYYNLPEELQMHIESFLNDKNTNIAKRYEKMYKRILNFKDCKRFNITHKHMIKRNQDTSLINDNLRIFFNVFNIKMEKDLPYRRALKIVRDETGGLLRYLDHKRVYYTYDKLYVVTSSPYNGAKEDIESHFKNGWIQYKLALYNNEATTFYKIIV